MTNLSSYQVLERIYHNFQYVDIFRALQTYAIEAGGAILKISNANSLQSILEKDFTGDNDRSITKPTYKSFATQFDKSEFFPDTIFIVILNELETSVIKFELEHYTNKGKFSLAIQKPEDGDKIFEKVEALAQENSIYKNSIIEVEITGEIKNYFGETESKERIELNFLEKEKIDDAKIILDAEIQKVLQNSIFDFIENYEILQKSNIPLKRGILFYGPPGTGKTYTSKYIANKLQNVTSVIGKGKSLFEIKSICQIARLLQPSLVILEDVDLLFSSRDINYQTTLLGEFLDQLDGISKNDKVCFILTTNSIERIESAIKDRPGRISQCIFMGALSKDLRKKFIESYLQQYGASCENIDEIVAMTKNATQAFLKELVIRTIQIVATETRNTVSSVDEARLIEAYKIMIKDSNHHSRNILGFAIDN
ncbi:MAG: ATP-binding protein [Spirochaetota bacterium]